VFTAVCLQVYNISYTSALYGLLLYYMATKHLLKGFHAVGKFAAVKIIVFATYYQSLLVTAIPGADTLGSSEKWNDFIICIEMFCFAVMHLYCFSHKEFLPGGVGMMNANRDDDDAPVNLKTDTTFSAAMSRAADVLSIKDVLEDATRNFSLRYGRYIMQGVEGGSISEGRADHVEANRPRGPPPVLPEIREVVVVKEKELGTDKESLFASAPDAIIQVKTTGGTVDTRKGGQVGKGKGGFSGREEEEEDDSDPYGLVIAVQGASDATQLEVVEPVMDAHLQANVPRPHKKGVAGRERGDTAGSFDADFSTIQRSDSKRSRAMSTSTGDNSHNVVETQIGAIGNASMASNKAALLAASAAAAASLIQAAKRPPIGSAVPHDPNTIDRTHSTGAPKGVGTGVSHALSSRGVGRAISGSMKPPSAPVTPQEKIKFAGDADAEEKEHEVLDNSFGAILSSDQGATVATDTIGQAVISPRDTWAPAFDDGFTTAKPAEALPVPKIIEASPVSLSDRQKKAQERQHSLKIDASKLRTPAVAPSSNHSSPEKVVATAVSVTADPSSWEFVPTSYEEEADAPVPPPSAAPTTQSTTTGTAAADDDWTAAAPQVDFSQAMSVGVSDTAMPTTMGSFDANSAAPAPAVVSVAWDAPTVEFKTAPLALKPPPVAGIARRIVSSHVEENTAAPSTHATTTTIVADAGVTEEAGNVDQHVTEHSFAPSDARLSFSPHHATTAAGHTGTTITPLAPTTLAAIQEVVSTPVESNIELDTFDAPTTISPPTDAHAGAEEAEPVDMGLDTHMGPIEEREEGEVTPSKSQHIQHATTIVTEDDMDGLQGQHGQHHTEVSNPFDDDNNTHVTSMGGEERREERRGEEAGVFTDAPVAVHSPAHVDAAHVEEAPEAPVNVNVDVLDVAAGVIELDTVPVRSPSPALPPPTYESPFDAAYPYDIHGPPFSPPMAEVTMTSPVAALDFSSPLVPASPAQVMRTPEAATPTPTHASIVEPDSGSAHVIHEETEKIVSPVTSSLLSPPPGAQFTSPEVQPHVVDTPMSTTSHATSMSQASHSTPAVLLPASPPLFSTPTSVAAPQASPAPAQLVTPLPTTAAVTPASVAGSVAHVQSQSLSRPSSFVSSDHHTPVLVSTKSTTSSSSSSSRRGTLDGAAGLPFGVVPSMPVQPKREHTTASSSSLPSLLPVDTMPHASAASFTTTPTHEATPTELSAADTGAAASFVDDVHDHPESSPPLEAALSVDPEVATDMAGFAHVIEDGIDEFTAAMDGRSSSAPSTPVQPHNMSVPGSQGMTTPNLTPGAAFEWDMTPDASAMGGETPQDDFSF
jgi:hypothetical protein